MQERTVCTSKNGKKGWLCGSEWEVRKVYDTKQEGQSIHLLVNGHGDIYNQLTIKKQYSSQKSLETPCLSILSLLILISKILPRNYSKSRKPFESSIFTYSAILTPIYIFFFSKLGLGFYFTDLFLFSRTHETWWSIWHSALPRSFFCQAWVTQLKSANNKIL